LEIVKQPIPPGPGASDLPSRTRRTSDLVAAGLLTAASFVLFWPVLFGGRTLFGRDITPFFYPMKHVLVESIRSGTVPFWNPGIANGEPFFASLQPGVLYPGSLLLYLIPLSVSFDWLIVLHYPLAGVGLYLLLRRSGRSAAAAWVGAAAFMLGGYLVSIGNFPNNLQTVAWIPWLFWAWDRFLEQPVAGRLAVFSGLCAIAFLGGEPQMLGLSLLWVFLHGALRIEERQLSRWRQVAGFAAAGAVALALVAVQLIPFVEFVAHSVRTMAVDMSYASARSLEPAGLVHLWIPPVLDAGVHDFTTRFLAASSTPWILSPYPGAVAGGLALVGIGFVGGRRAAFWTGSALLGVLFALGASSPAYRFLFDTVPLLRPFRYPEKFLLLPAMAIAVLAAAGADAAIESGRRIRASAILGVGAALFGMVATGLTLMPNLIVETCGGPIREAALCADPLTAARLYAGVSFRLCLLAGLAALAIGTGGRGRLRPEAVVGLLGMLVVADLIAAHARVNPSVESRVYAVPAWPARALDGIGADPQAYRFRGSPHEAAMGNVVTVPGAHELTNLYLDFETMGPNVGQLAGYLHQDGLQGVELRSVAMTNDAAVNGWAQDPVRFLRAMNVRWYADPTSAADSLTGLRIVARHPDLPLRLFEVPDPLPRAYLVSDWEQARSPGAALSRTLEAGFPLGKTVVLEESPQADLLGGTGQVLEADYRLNQIRLKTRTTGPMVLVVNDRHYPGWKARVNGVDVPMLRAGGIFRAVVVPQGDTQVEFIFRPSRLLPGALLSILGLLALAGLSLSYRNRTTTGANPSASGQIP
jgi:hypothetical protein